MATLGDKVRDFVTKNLACSRRSDSGAQAKNKASERAGKKTRGDWGRGRGNACEIFSKEAVPVYQNLVYPLIGQI